MHGSAMIASPIHSRRVARGAAAADIVVLTAVPAPSP
jgi:hypothetical protein